MAEQDLSEYPDPNTFRILIVTDTHLGLLEEDEVRRYDSFRAFDEALSIGRKYNVDFVLHAGDLFEKNQPSRFCMVETLRILRKHCLGQKAIHFNIVSDQTVNFPSSGRVNFLDPNYNVALPMFIQHGNHDDPARLGGHAALEQLAASNLVNYVGRMDDADNLCIFPILMEKGDSKLAVYPLGYIRDERLHRAFLHHKVKWVKPKEAAQDWFNIAMIHQNRTRHSAQYKNCIPDEFLPKWLDVAYFGHEHECRIELQESSTTNFFVTQPGSTVITSLSQSEAKPKHCGILEVVGDECRMVPIALKSTRQFLFDEVTLSDHFEEDIELQDIDDFLKDRVQGLVDRAREERESNGDQNGNNDGNEDENEENDLATLPIIRLRVDHTNFPKLRAAQFGHHFVKTVANPSSILLFHRRSARKGAAAASAEDDKDRLFDFGQHLEDTESIEDIVSRNVTEGSKLSVFPELDLLSSVREFVEKEDPKSMEQFCENLLENLAGKLIEDECPAETTDICAQSEKQTASRRTVLRQQLAMKMLQKEEQEKIGEEMKAETVNNTNSVKIESESVRNQSNLKQSKNSKNLNKSKNVKKPKKVASLKRKQVDLMLSESEDELDLPKKKKAKLRDLGSSQYSQHSQVRPTGANRSSVVIQDTELEEDFDMDDDLGHNMKRNHNENHNHNHNTSSTSHRVLRSMRSQDLNQSNVDDASLDLSRFSFNESMNERKGKTQGTQQSQTIEETQNRNTLNTQTQTQRRRRPKRSTKAKASKWPKLRAKR